jgi:hypothetical protein
MKTKSWTPELPRTIHSTVEGSTERSKIDPRQGARKFNPSVICRLLPSRRKLKSRRLLAAIY